MITMRRNVVRSAMRIAMALALTSACASSRVFDRLISEQRWTEAAQTFSLDSTLMNDESALYAAGMLFGSPTRTTYDPARARMLFDRLLIRFPDTKHATDVKDRLALMDDAVRVRASVERARQLEVRIAELVAQQQRMRAQLDSAAALGDVQRRATAKLESDLRDRDEQLRALRLELRQLKEIDLKPRASDRRTRP